MGSAGAELLVTLQILPGFFSNCLFMALYDSVVLLKRVVSLLSCSRSVSCGEWRRMLTSAGLRAIWNSFLLDAYKQVKLGREAPNSKVVKVPESSRWSSAINSVTSVPRGARTQTGDECRLLDFESSDRPLVLVEDFSDVADFLLVYIDEAHPSDGWVAPQMGPCSFSFRKHQNLEERMGAARQLIEHFSLPPQCQLVADCMDNNANVAYGVSNERVCIVHQRKIAYLGGKGPFFYNLKEVRQWLEQLR
ncbi:Type II iodothyronine deiodinase [Oryzias melastigma]|uniref:Iodothyronine deiodinase n=1 Tax=Oryzias melastigma TaxID=30732 RepID=A0A834CNV9_ORYME|nr:Type II iodothyronine deiodinase [Oryzias melastigma]